MKENNLSYLSLAISSVAIVVSVSSMMANQGEKVSMEQVTYEGTMRAVGDGSPSAKEAAMARLKEIREANGSKEIEGANNSQVKEEATSQEPASSKESEEQEVADGDNEERQARRVDLSLLRDNRTHVQYDNNIIAKLGYDDDGRRMSPREAQEDTQQFVKRILSQGERFSFVYPAIGEERKRVIVFSDPTCPYCQRLHSSMDEIREAGVTVYYMMFPRALANGERDPTASRIISSFEYAWCDDDPSSALDRVYSAGIDRYRATSCEAPEEQDRVSFPYAEHYLMTKMADINATPVTLTEDGFKIQGFSNVRQYLNQIGM